MGRPDQARQPPDRQPPRADDRRARPDVDPPPDPAAGFADQPDRSTTVGNLDDARTRRPPADPSWLGTRPDRAGREQRPNPTRATGAPPPEPSLDVHVTIGRIEVVVDADPARAPVPPVPAAPRRDGPTPLDRYLRARSSGRLP
jgi:hypothetical protein